MPELRFMLSAHRDGATAWIGCVTCSPIDFPFEVDSASATQEDALDALSLHLANSLELVAAKLRQRVKDRTS